MRKPPLLEPDAALFLDFDGTLVDFADHPDEVFVDQALAVLLTDLVQRHGGAVAIVSGRSIKSIDALTGGVLASVAGLHGAERRNSDGEVVKRAPIPPEMSAAKESLRDLAARIGGIIVEDKGAQIALHYRNNPAAADACRNGAQIAARFSDNLTVYDGNMVVELRPYGIGKDTAIKEFMHEPPFAGRAPVFIGDDMTDEDGFRYVAARKGLAILAGIERPTAAAHHLEDVAAVRAWLMAGLMSKRAGG